MQFINSDKHCKYCKLTVHEFYVYVCSGSDCLSRSYFIHIILNSYLATFAANLEYLKFKQQINKQFKVEFADNLYLTLFWWGSKDNKTDCKEVFWVK